MTEVTTVRVVHRFDAASERVFDAWLDPALAGRFLFATPAGRMARAEIDPRVGGRFTFTDRRGGEDVDHVGEYLVIDRPRRLVFSFAVTGFLDQPTTVSLDITPRGEGCELILTHEKVLADYGERTRQGWGMILDGLAKTLA